MCGIAILRLRKPLDHYLDKHGTALYGLHKMVLMMEKQHNRGQDGGGLAGIKLNMPAGHRYISRSRSVDSKPIQDIFARIQSRIEERLAGKPERLKDAAWVKQNLAFACDVFIGHLRYGTYGGNSIEACHPFLRQSNYMSRNLLVAGNFNMTNVDELFKELVSLGQHPKEKADTVTVMEKIGHFLDKENRRLHHIAKDQLGLNKVERSQYQADHLDLPRVLEKASRDWDGGYAMGGIIGQGDAFLLRDPHGIRPAFYYVDDEVAVVASERPVIQTAFGVSESEVLEVPPGHAVWIRRNGDVSVVPVCQPAPNASCSFERIYFSRANDGEIYRERLELGHRLTDRVMKAAGNDFDRTIFSFIPNTAEIAFYGLVKGAEDLLKREKSALLIGKGSAITPDDIELAMAARPRVEKIAWKDVKLRTFIAQDSGRDDMVAHVYDSTYGIVGPEDSIVALDDSIVRGTTLKQSILSMLDRLKPKRIVVVSSAPQIRYPDCYGIDMAKLGDFIAFQAAVSLLRERKMDSVLDQAHADAKAELAKPMAKQRNAVQSVYAPFSDEELSDRIAELLTPAGTQAEVKVVYQTVADLHEACPNSPGDWYFTGNYPTPGGVRVANRAFVNYMEGKTGRAY
jgi:amidophosphoribosyltransferase